MFCPLRASLPLLFPSPPWCLSPNPQNASSAPAGVTASQRGERLLFQGTDCQRERRYIFFFSPCLRQRRQFLSICPKKGRKLNLFLQRCQHTASIGSQGVCDRGSVVERGERLGGWWRRSLRWGTQRTDQTLIEGEAKIWGCRNKMPNEKENYA